jgi:prepilin-type N-terminal cleavage/methylation domain-containing protein
MRTRARQVNRDGRRAFTLIEIMLALAIFAGVLAAIYSCWTAILRGTKVALDTAAEVQRSRIAGRTLEEALACAQLFQANARHYAFEADTSEEDASLSFVAYLPPSFPRSGKFGDLPLRRVAFTVEPAAGGGKHLVLRQAPLLFDLDVDEEENPLELAQSVESFQMEFLGANSRRWETEWAYTNQLPRMVRFRLETRAPSRTEPRVVMRTVFLPVTTTLATGPIRPPGALPPGAGGTNPPVRPPSGTRSVRPDQPTR